MGIIITVCVVFFLLRRRRNLRLLKEQTAEPFIAYEVDQSIRVGDIKSWSGLIPLSWRINPFRDGLPDEAQKASASRIPPSGNRDDAEEDSNADLRRIFEDRRHEARLLQFLASRMDPVREQEHAENRDEVGSEAPPPTYISRRR